jgi:predicted methyltransferase
MPWASLHFSIDVALTIDVRLGAFPDALGDIEADSAALVVADPPWDDLAAFATVGQFSGRVLRQGGILLAYIGNRWCFEAIDLLSISLNRVRLAFLPSPHEMLWDPEVSCHEAGSFMMILSKGAFNPSSPWTNAVEGEVRGHQWHPHQRPLANVRHYIEAFSEPTDTVIDPFLGAGTTAVACAQLGRNFVGCDLHPENVESTLERLRIPDEST